MGAYERILADAEEDGKIRERIDVEGIRIGMSSTWAAIIEQQRYAQLLQQMTPEQREMFERARADYPTLDADDIDRALTARRNLWDVEVRNKVGLDDIVAMMLRFLLPLAGLAVLTATVLRGNVTYWLTGITIQRPDGKRAGRLRVLARTLMTWSPVLAFVAFARLVTFGWEEWVAVPLLALLLAGAIYAVARPSAGLQDRLVGTQLEPR